MHAPLTVALALALSAAPPEAPPPSRASPDVERPLKWLLAAQDAKGAWGVEVGQPPDVATTAISGISLIRSGFTASHGAHQEHTRKAVGFVVRAVEAVPYDTLAIQAEGTLPQRKLGRYVDTFLAAQFLAEALPDMPAGKDHDRTAAALDWLVHKVQKLQQANGSFAGGGWAPVLGTAFASDALHAAKQVGSSVSGQTVAAADNYLVSGYDAKTGSIEGKADSAGVKLYETAAVAKSTSHGAGGGMGGMAAKASISQMQDESTLRGFGSYGGEEHVSYMMTSEALAKVGGKQWEDWDKKIRQRLATIQRPDGTWRGDHCITSTAFCTAASLITLAVRPAEIPTR
jgi:hypothetical protein